MIAADHMRDFIRTADRAQNTCHCVVPLGCYKYANKSNEIGDPDFYWEVTM